MWTYTFFEIEVQRLTQYNIFFHIPKTNHYIGDINLNFEGLIYETSEKNNYSMKYIDYSYMIVWQLREKLCSCYKISYFHHNIWFIDFTGEQNITKKISEKIYVYLKKIKNKNNLIRIEN